MENEMRQNLKTLRKKNGLTLEALAEKLGVSTQMISNLELGKKAIRPENLAKVCELLDLSSDYVLTGTNTKTAVDAVASCGNVLITAERGSKNIEAATKRMEKSNPDRYILR